MQPLHNLQRHPLRKPLALALLLGGMLLAACERAPEIERRQFFALGTLVDVSLPASEQNEAHFEALEKELLQLEHRWRAWQHGDVADLNREWQTTAAVTPDAALVDGIRQALSLKTASLGYFDPTIGELVALWGFEQEERPAVSPPTADQLQQWRSRHEQTTVQFDGTSLMRDGAPLWLDFGAFAKGLALNHARELLLRRNVVSGIVNAGGDLVVLGDKQGQPWRIGIRNPRGNGMLGSLQVRGDIGVVTSGDYERYFEWQGRRYHHVLNPFTAQPASGFISITVVHADAAVADAAATALMAAGPAHWREVAASMGLDKFLIVTEHGKILLTASLQPHFELLDAQHAVEVLP